MKIKINWISTKDGADPTGGGYWSSSEGRFTIAPRYRHTIYPDAYKVRDRISGVEETYDRVWECKAWAVNRCQAEFDKENA